MGDIRLIGIFGNLGCYKTALAVCVVRMIREEHSFGDWVMPIVSNVNVKLPFSRQLEVSDLVGSDYIDTIMFEDEIYTIADSRLSMSEQNVFYSYSIAQARKSPHEEGGNGTGNFVVYTAQLQSMADIRLFDLTNLYIMVDKLPNGDCYVESVTDSDDYSECVIPREFFVDNSFNFYDTHQKIYPKVIESLRFSMEKNSNPVKANVRVDGVVDRFLERFGFSSYKEVCRFTVNDFLFGEGLPEKLAPYVFDRVRERLRMQELGK